MSVNQELKVIPIELENGSVIRIQATPIEATETVQQRPGEEIESDVSLKILSLDEVTDMITSIAEKIKRSVDTVKPTKAKVEFGIEFGWDSGQLISMIAKGSGKADLKISLEWGKPEEKD